MAIKYDSTILPLQPVYKDEEGTVRFRENSIVRYLLDNGGINMNQIFSHSFPQSDLEQFASLIGYSLSGFAELSYVSDEAYGTAERMANGIAELQARNLELREQLSNIRAGLKIAVSAAFKIDGEDLEI